MGGVRPFIAARPIVGTAHIGSGTDTLIRPVVPHAVGVIADRDYRCLGRPNARRPTKENSYQRNANRHVHNPIQNVHKLLIDRSDAHGSATHQLTDRKFSG